MGDNLGHARHRPRARRRSRKVLARSEGVIRDTQRGASKPRVSARDQDEAEVQVWASSWLPRPFYPAFYTVLIEIGVLSVFFCAALLPEVTECFVGDTETLPIS